MRDSSQPPPSNRGVEITTGLDWYEGTVKGVRPERVIGLLEDVLDGEFVRLDRGRQGYSSHAQGPGASSVLYAKGREDVHLSIPGRGCALAGEAGLRSVLRQVRSAGHVTRLDLRGDDPTSCVLPADVREAIVRGEAVTRARTAVSINSLIGDRAGETVTLGKRGSAVFLRVYDKTAESKGEINGVRWELELRDEIADAVASQLDDGRGIGEVWAERLCSFVDFREVGDGNTTRRKRLDWFDGIVSGMKRAVIYSPAPEFDYDRARTWIVRQAGPLMAALVDGDAGDLGAVEEAIAQGRLRRGQRHQRLVSTRRRQHEAASEGQGR